MLKFGIGMLLAALPWCAFAQPRELTTADAEAFLDGLLPLQLERDDIAGAVVAIVKDGRVLLAKGYGYANVAGKTPVSPDSTLFRPGSISKLFVWTSVMQQVEQGKLDLDRDVNDYLDFRIPAPFGKPLTLRHIMTHTSGFEETVRELFVSNEQRLMPLDVYLKTHLPKQIFAPGTTPAYSNYATSLAGYIVQRISGEPFEQYIERHIFQPLGMTRCTFRQPLAEALVPLMSAGYKVASAPAKTFEFVAAVPAGSSSVNATGMTRFMLAHLNGGEFEGARILKPETIRLMHARQFGLHPQMNAMALGFYEESRNGHRVIGHGGDTGWFHSDLHLVPDLGLGFFVSYNSAGQSAVAPRQVLWQKFFDRYWPPAALAPPLASSRTSAEAVAGHYLASRRAETTVVSLLNAVSQQEVNANSDGTLSFDGARKPSGAARKFREVAPMLFEDEEGTSRLAFKKSASGQWTAATSFPAIMLEHSSGARNQTFNLLLLAFAGIVLVPTLLLWPVAALARWHYGQRLGTVGYEPTRWAGRLAALCYLLALLAIAYIGFRAQDIGLLGPPLDPALRIAQVFALVGVLLTLVALFHAFRTVRKPVWWWTRVHECLMAAGLLAISWFVIYWRLLTPSLRY